MKSFQPNHDISLLFLSNTILPPSPPFSNLSKGIIHKHLPIESLPNSNIQIADMISRAFHLSRSNLTNPNRLLFRPPPALALATKLQPTYSKSPPSSSVIPFSPIFGGNLRTSNFSTNASNPQPPGNQPTISTWSRGSESLSSEERRLIEVNGESTVKFIQGLVTSDVDKMADLYQSNPGGSGCWPTAFLSNKGRVISDALIWMMPPLDDSTSTPTIVLDVPANTSTDLINHLNSYKLRKTKVEIQDVTDEKYSIHVIYGVATRTIEGGGHAETPPPPPGSPVKNWGDDPRENSLGLRGRFYPMNWKCHGIRKCRTFIFLYGSHEHLILVFSNHPSSQPPHPPFFPRTPLFCRSFSFDGTYS